MRGKLAGCVNRLDCFGITPADAGKTIPQLVDAGMQLGSPPRMRGKPGEIKAGAQIVGITPADAGKTIRMPELTRLYEDHPRGCGENRVIEDGLDTTTRITPADAGKTLPLNSTV